MGTKQSTKRGKLSGATLLESVLALGLMATALSFAVGLHFRIAASDRAMELLQAWSFTEVEVATHQVWGYGLGTNDEADRTPFLIERTERAVGPGLVELTIRCVRRERVVLTRRCILPSQR